MLRTPGQDREGVQVGTQVLVALIDADKALNAAAVDHDFIVDSLFDLAGGDCHVLQLAENIRKLHPDKFHVVFLDHADDVFLRVLAHNADLLSIDYRNKKRARRIVQHDTLALMGVS